MTKAEKLFIKEFGLELQLTKIGSDRFLFLFPNDTVPTEIVFKIGRGFSLCSRR